jgi:hypothetical protein
LFLLESDGKYHLIRGSGITVRKTGISRLKGRGTHARKLSQSRKASKQMGLWIPEDYNNPQGLISCGE